MERTIVPKRTVPGAAYRRVWNGVFTMEREHEALIDLGNFPEIYADGIGDVFAVGQTAHVLLFRWRKIDGILRRCISGEVVRPVEVVQAEEICKWQRVFHWGEAALLH